MAAFELRIALLAFIGLSFYCGSSTQSTFRAAPHCCKRLLRIPRSPVGLSHTSTGVERARFNTMGYTRNYQVTVSEMVRVWGRL